MGAQGLGRLPGSMGGEVIQDDDRARFDLGDQDFADVGGESRAIHRPLEAPRGDQRIVGEARDQRLRSPTSERGVHLQSHAAWGTAPQAGQVGLHRRFIKEDNAFRFVGNSRQSMFEPIPALLPYPCTAALGGHQRFFL